MHVISARNSRTHTPNNSQTFAKTHPRSISTHAIHTAYAFILAFTLATALTLLATLIHPGTAAADTPDSGATSTSIPTPAPSVTDHAAPTDRNTTPASQSTAVSKPHISDDTDFANPYDFSLSPDSGADLGGHSVTITPPPAVTFTQASTADPSPTDENASSSMALATDGAIYAWGDNTYGQLGDGTTTDRLAPVKLTMPAGVHRYTTISMGGTSALAIGDDGNTYAWGCNTSGQLGIGATASTGGTTTPTNDQITSTPAPKTIGGTCTTDAPKDGAAINFSSTPVKVKLPVIGETATSPGTTIHFTDVSTSCGFAVAIGDDGKAYAWGNNYYNQLGIGATAKLQLAPTEVRGVPDDEHFTAISAGPGYVIATGYHHLLDGSVSNNTYAWGINNYGQLGLGDTGKKTVPTLVPDIYNDSFAHGTKIDLYHPQTVHTDTTWKASSVTAKVHTLALGSDGNVYAWGANDRGQLGRGTTVTNASTRTPAAVPKPATAGSEFTQISVGRRHSIALDDRGQLWTWGDNTYGQLGDGATDPNAPVTSPIHIAMPQDTKVTSISAGQFGTFASCDDQYAYDWGTNTNGQLGLGLTSPDPTTTPIKVRIVKILSVAFDGTPTAAPVYDPDTGTWTVTTPPHDAGKVTVTIAWQLGESSAGVQPDAGLHYTYTSTLGSDPEHPAPETPHFYPVCFATNGGSLPAGTDAKATHTCPHKPDTHCPAGLGQLCETIDRGNIALMPKTNPTKDGWNFDGWYDATDRPYDFTKAVTEPITLTAHWSQWHSMTPMEAPDYGKTDITVTPPTGVRFYHVSAGGSHSLALGTDGNTYAWGLNNYGRLGDGTTATRTSPVKVKTPVGVRFIRISAGLYHSMAIGDDGNVYTWGCGDKGQLGDGRISNGANHISQTTPLKVTLPAGVTATQIAAGGGHSLALGDNGRIYAWGDGEAGELGDGRTGDGYLSPTPVEVNLPGVTFTKVYAGNSHSIATDADGNTWAWGYNDYGQLGNGTTKGCGTPQAIAATDTSGASTTKVAVSNSCDTSPRDNGGAGAAKSASGTSSTSTSTSTSGGRATSTTSIRFRDISVGADHTIGLDEHGHVWAWGRNQYGQLGQGTVSGAKTANPTPQRVTIPGTGATQPFITQIFAGSNHNLAIDSTGTAWTWGKNDKGQLGCSTSRTSSLDCSKSANGSTSTSTNIATPTKVNIPTGAGIVQASGGGSHSLVIGTDGNTYAAGDNSNGQVGSASAKTTLPQRATLGPVTMPAPATTITFGGTPATAFSYEQKQHRFIATTPAHETGHVDVNITWTPSNGNPKQTVTFSDFHFIPTVAAIPLTGGTARGTLLAVMLAALAFTMVAVYLKRRRDGAGIAVAGMGSNNVGVSNVGGDNVSINNINNRTRHTVDVGSGTSNHNNTVDIRDRSRVHSETAVSSVPPTPPRRSPQSHHGSARHAKRY